MDILLGKPRLYKKNSNGSIQYWDIWVTVKNGTHIIITEWGKFKGKVQHSEEIIKNGKNIGKSNETTPLQQAELNMNSTWTKKLKKGYVDTLEDAINGILNEIIKGGIVPMTAHVFEHQGHKIKFPAILQPKLDGHRSTSQSKIHDITSLWSRSRKEIKSVPHIMKTISETYEDIFDIVGMYIDKLDGEMYNHDYKDDFEVLTSFIKQDSPKEGYEEVQMHVYDFEHPTLTNYERYETLEKLRPLFDNTPIKIVESIIVNNLEELKAAYIYFMELGYEGAMIRNFDGLYVNKKSYDLQKYKEFDDDEFEVINVKVGTKGKMKGLGIFVCQTKEGNRFDCKMKGELKNLKQYADNPEIAIGRQLTVQFQGYTKKNNVPRFPVGLRFRVDI